MIKTKIIISDTLNVNVILASEPAPSAMDSLSPDLNIFAVLLAIFSTLDGRE